ncbi:E3 ubiquitin-protein ligase MARCHF7 isoform X13 [Calonectris borealis]|uniref:E3 ubiquitin-protein ligase MARCHF7 isoform X13 n=1 Tax=Calonectris borealis TaxID=1323832 RepID=UPI003F4BE058
MSALCGLCRENSSWRYSRIPRSSSVMLGSLGTELVRERRELERRTDLSVNNLVDHSYRNSDFSSSTYLQDRPASSYAEGARPKENSLSTLRLNASMNRQLPSDHQPSFFNRDSNMSSSRSSYSARQRRNELESPQRSMQPAFSLTAIRDETPSSSGSERVLPSQRSLNEPAADSEGRRTTRQLLSRLASSMSSTFFSRRSSQDSLHTRSLGSEESTVVPRVQASTLSSSNGAATPEVPGLQTSEASQGFSFLRRRWGLSGVSQNHNSDSDGESYRQDSESRSTGSWLSSSLRNRCTPLFSRRRREGRDESARISTSDTTARSQHVFRRRESGEETSLEASDSPPRASVSRPPTPAVSGIPTATASPPDSAHSRRSSGILPGSLFRFAVPPTLGSSLSDNLMITVDIIPSGWNQSDGQESGKSKIPPSRDPERLQKIKESLLLEDSEDEEGDLCRICQMSSASSDNLLIEPCKCTGSLQYVHQECMKKWLQSKINSGSSLEAVTTCELCKEKLHLNLEDFDIHELYRAHANEQADYEFISSGLYLVVLLHLCEQRFSDMLGTASEASTRVRQVLLSLKKGWLLIVNLTGSGCLPVELRGPQKIMLIVPNADELVLTVLQVGSVGVHSAVCLPWKLLKLWAKNSSGSLYCFPAHMCFGVSYLKLRVQCLSLMVYFLEFVAEGCLLRGYSFFCEAQYLSGLIVYSFIDQISGFNIYHHP